MQLTKSPLNYIGGKYKLLPQLLTLFPENITNFYDLFAGGCDVCTNIQAKKVYANDINGFVIRIYKTFQGMSIESLLQSIDTIIKTYDLSKTNQDGFLKLRQHYNDTPIEYRNPIELFVLVCYSFNHQFRFNTRYNFNSSFGKEKSSFNPSIRNNLISFHSKLTNIVFSSQDFKTIDLSFLSNGDFLYADPPYRITTAVYNETKRGFKGWTLEDDKALFRLLDNLNTQGVKFALSNVSEHKGRVNETLIQWMSKYTVHPINFNYAHSNYQAHDNNPTTKEVLVTNYTHF